jgi:hypothetical protein
MDMFSTRIERGLPMLRKLGLILTSVAFMLASACHLQAAPGSGSAAPPNGYVVYSRFEGRWLPENTSARYDLFLFKTSKKANLVRLTSKSSGLGAAVWYPIFSPDSKLILFNANNLPGNINLDLLESPTYRMQLGLRTISVSSRRLRTIPEKGNGYELLSWSPDGKFVCMTSPSKLSGLDDSTPVFDDVFVWDAGKADRKSVM